MLLVEFQRLGIIMPIDYALRCRYQTIKYHFIFFFCLLNIEHVFQVSALDVDSFEGGQVTYSILSGNEDNIFQLDPKTGVLSVVNGLKIDEDTKPVYYLAIEAMDG